MISKLTPQLSLSRDSISVAVASVRQIPKLLSMCAMFLMAFLAASSMAITVSSSSNDGNIDINTLDGDLNTRWSAQGHGEWIQYDMEALLGLVKIDIAFHKGEERSTEFAVLSSIDGLQWSTLWHGAQTELTNTMQSFEVDSGTVQARFLRIVGYGNSENDWISVSEVVIEVSSNPLHDHKSTNNYYDKKYPAYSSSVNHQDSSVIDTLDGDLNTYWAANGLGQWISFDLGKEQTVSSIDLSFYNGDKRVSAFEIETSTDGFNWKSVFSGQQNVLTRQLQNVNVADSSARYLRITGFGNSQNDWFTLSEVSINSDSLSF